MAFTRKIGFPKLSKDERSKAGPIEAAQYDQMVAKAENDELIRQKPFRASMLEHKSRLAAMLMAALRPKAGSRLRALRAAHQIQGTDVYDGPGMWKELKDHSDKPLYLAERRVHDRAIEAARDMKLPNGCAAQAYAEKVQMLVRDHLPYASQVFSSNDDLGRFLIDMMPACNDSEGRTLAR